MRTLIDLLTWVRLWLNLQGEESGQDLAEYGLIIALIAVVAIAALEVLGGGISTALDSVATALSGAGPE